MKAVTLLIVVPFLAFTAATPIDSHHQTHFEHEITHPSQLLSQITNTTDTYIKNVTSDTDPKVAPGWNTTASSGHNSTSYMAQSPEGSKGGFWSWFKTGDGV